jgi:DNA-binding transcriptional LysR family regulator
MLRVGVASEFAGRLAPRLGQLRPDAGVGSGFEVITDESEALASAFRQSTLDIAFLVGGEIEAPAAGRWRAPLRWFGVGGGRSSTDPVRIAIAPRGSALHEAAVEALRAQGRKFDIVCLSADFAVLAAAASAGLGVAPMIEGLAPDGLKPCADESLPALPPVTLSLLARSPALEAAGRRWLGDAVETLQSL